MVEAIFNLEVEIEGLQQRHTKEDDPIESAIADCV